MTETTEVRAVLVDGKPYQKMADGSLVPLEDRTDWARLDAMTDEEVEAAAMSDPDGLPMTDEEWAQAEIIRPGKVSVGLKLDDDVVNWFKARGRGYEARMNNALREYMEAHRKTG